MLDIDIILPYHWHIIWGQVMFHSYVLSLSAEADIPVPLIENRAILFNSNSFISLYTDIIKNIFAK